MPPAPPEQARRRARGRVGVRRGRGAGFGAVVIAEPGEAVGELAGALVPAVGARGADAVASLRAAGAAGAVAVAVREAGDDVRAAAAPAGVALLVVPAGLRWDEVETVARAELARAAATATGHRGDLYSLAQTLASLTQGLVSVEDTGHRVFAYAGPTWTRSAMSRPAPAS
ncbi:MULTISPECIES: hypothetical protein [unclassified Streptomyces]|uniref:hypothetical protein n=1 Tax=unclassified Streptomyces TaxID=2593676 RepID=UPI000ADBF87E|nr:hypothetical protein [Streptomyces sp. TSRI0107]